MPNAFQSNRLKYTLLLLASILFVTSADGQTKKSKQLKKNAPPRKEQTSFSSEGKIIKPVKLPPAILKQLAEYDNGRLAECQRDSFTRRRNNAQHFAAAQINLSPDRRSRRALLVQAQTPCFMGAHNTTFWLFVKTADDAAAEYQMIFDISVDSLKILLTSANNLRDLETASHTAVELFTVQWKFDGQKYQKSECRATNADNKVSRINCDF